MGMGKERQFTSTKIKCTLFLVSIEEFEEKMLERLKQVITLTSMILKRKF